MRSRRRTASSVNQPSWLTTTRGLRRGLRSPSSGERRADHKSPGSSTERRDDRQAAGALAGRSPERRSRTARHPAFSAHRCRACSCHRPSSLTRRDLRAIQRRVENAAMRLHVAVLGARHRDGDDVRQREVLAKGIEAAMRIEITPTMVPRFCSSSSTGATSSYIRSDGSPTTVRTSARGVDDVGAAPAHLLDDRRGVVDEDVVPVDSSATSSRMTDDAAVACRNFAGSTSMRGARRRAGNPRPERRAG